MPTALVTGANRGIGLELSKQLAARGYEVVAACRTASKELEAANVRVVENLDVTSDESVGALDAGLGDTQLDLLVANQGVLAFDALDRLDFGAIRAQIEVNALGSLRVVAALRHRLKKGAKVALVTSRMGSIADNTSGGYYGYRMSKAALNMAGMSLSHDLRDAGVAVCILHPGYVRTDMTGGSGNVSPHDSAHQLLDRIDALTLESSGTFWHASGEKLPW